MSCEHFIQQFHNLAGNTVNEKKRCLFQLFHRNSSLLQDDLDAITSALVPENYLENLFFIEFLIYFKRSNELFEKFKNGDEFVISKASRHAWFFKHVISSINVESLVNELLPSVSFCVRSKILKKLHLDEETGDKIFERLRQTYGVHFASKILEKCSRKKIEGVLQNCPVQLTVVQLQVLFDKEPKLISLYFEEKLKHDKAYNVAINPIFLYIAKKNPDMFCELKAKYKIDVALGKRATKKFVSSKKAEVLAKPDVYHSNLSSASVVRCLGKDFANYYSVLFKTHENEDLLKHYPKNGRFDLYKKTYTKILNKQFSYSENVMEMLSASERERVAKDLFKESGDEKYYQYYNPSECFEIVTSKLNTESNDTLRGKYIGYVSKSCISNQNVDVLLKVCRLVNGRFKNDTLHIREALLSAVSGSDLVDRFDENIWRILVEILSVRKMRGEWYFSEHQLSHKYIEFLFNNNRPIRDAIKEHVEELLYYDNDAKVNISSKFHKHLLTECIEAFYEMSETKSADQEKIQNFHVENIEKIERYNRKNGQDPIDIYAYPKLIQMLKDCVADTERNYYDLKFCQALDYVINRKDADAELVKLYFEKFEHVGTTKSIVWYLKHDPRVIYDNFGNIFEHLNTVRGLNAQKIWYLIKKYHQFNDKAIELCLSKLQDDSYSVREDLTKPLAILMQPRDYIELTRKYKPVAKKVDMIDQEAAKLYKIQTKMALFLKKLKAPEEVLPLLLEFCAGDYLEMSLSSLYSSTYNLPQNRAKCYLDELWNKPALSVKKHSLFLACEVLDQESVLDYLSKASLPTILAIILKYFVKNPNEKLWELFKTNLVKLEDPELLKIAIATKYPIRYRAEALQLLWNATGDNKPLKDTFISGLSDCDMPVISIDLCKQILEYELDASFITKFLELHKDPRKYKLVLEKANGHRYFAQLCQTHLENIWNNGKNDGESVSSLTANFSPNPEEAFKEYVMIELIKSKAAGQDSLEDAVVELRRSLVEIYGEFVQEPLLDALKDCLGCIFKNESDRYRFYYNLLKNRLFVDDALFVVRLMSAAELKYADSAKFYEQTMKLLRDFNSNPAVQLQVNFYLRPSDLE